VTVLSKYIFNAQITFNLRDAVCESVKHFGDVLDCYRPDRAIASQLEKMADAMRTALVDRLRFEYGLKLPRDYLLRVEAVADPHIVLRAVAWSNPGSGEITVAEIHVYP